MVVASVEAAHADSWPLPAALQRLVLQRLTLTGLAPGVPGQPVPEAHNFTLSMYAFNYSEWVPELLPI